MRDPKRHPPIPTKPRFGSQDIVRTGEPEFDWRDLYHFMLRISWRVFLALVAASYLLVNVLFALLYRLDAQGISHARPGAFTDAFFFSVQTLSTIGYGVLSPASLYANILVTLEALVGLTGFALVAGLVFARFARPTARILFSEIAVLTARDGVPTLMFRIANRRHNLILEAQARVALLRNETTREGEQMRALHDLRLVRNESPMVPLTWLIMHPVDALSPLYGATEETLQRQAVQLIVTVNGIDEVMAQRVRARHVYRAEDVRWNMRFVDVLGRLPDGRTQLDYTRFHDAQSSLPGEADGRGSGHAS